MKNSLSLKTYSTDMGSVGRSLYGTVIPYNKTGLDPPDARMRP